MTSVGLRVDCGYALVADIIGISWEPLCISSVTAIIPNLAQFSKCSIMSAEPESKMFWKGMHNELDPNMCIFWSF